MAKINYINYAKLFNSKNFSETDKYCTSTEAFSHTNPTSKKILNKNYFNNKLFLNFFSAIENYPENLRETNIKGENFLHLFFSKNDFSFYEIENFDFYVEFWKNFICKFPIDMFDKKSVKNETPISINFNNIHILLAIYDVYPEHYDNVQNIMFKKTQNKNNIDKNNIEELLLSKSVYFKTFLETKNLYDSRPKIIIK